VIPNLSKKGLNQNEQGDGSNEDSAAAPSSQVISVFGEIVSSTTSIRWEERMMPHLESLAAKMLKNRDFGYLKTVAGITWGAQSQSQ
jgi:hypothetical protein